MENESSHTIFYLSVKNQVKFTLHYAKIADIDLILFDEYLIVIKLFYFFYLNFCYGAKSIVPNPSSAGNNNLVMLLTDNNGCKNVVNETDYNKYFGIKNHYLTSYSSKELFRISWWHIVLPYSITSCYPRCTHCELSSLHSHSYYVHS
jgi:hypothetical protein